MRSKVAQSIQKETPEEVRTLIRQYVDSILKINKTLQAKGFTQKNLAKKMNKKP